MFKYLSSLLLVALLSLAAPAFAQNSQAGAVLLLVEQGKFAQARALLRSYATTTPLDAMYLEAQIQRAEGNPQQAVVTLREILSQEPGLIIARRSLVQSLLDVQDFEAAAFHLRLLNRSDPNPSARRDYQAALARISQSKPYGVSASFSLTPSSNINRGTYNSEFETGSETPFRITSQEESGLGVQLGLSGFFTTQLGENTSLTFRTGGNVTRYSKDEFNRSSFSHSLSFSVSKGQRENWEITPYLTRNNESNQFSRTSKGLAVSYRRLLDAQTRLTFNANGAYNDYDTVKIQNGPTYSLGMTWERQMSPSLALLGGVTFGRSDPDAANYQHSSIGVRGGVSKTWKGGFATYLEMELGARDFDNAFAMGRPERSDQYLAISANVLNSKLSLQGFAPRLGCSVVLNRSNIEFFDYNVQECRVSLTRGF